LRHHWPASLMPPMRERKGRLRQRLPPRLLRKECLQFSWFFSLGRVSSSYHDLATLGLRGGRSTVSKREQAQPAATQRHLSMIPASTWFAAAILVSPWVRCSVLAVTRPPMKKPPYGGQNCTDAGGERAQEPAVGGDKQSCDDPHRPESAMAGRPQRDAVGGDAGRIMDPHGRQRRQPRLANAHQPAAHQPAAQTGAAERAGGSN
jgi:hypothetical protein